MPPQQQLGTATTNNCKHINMTSKNLTGDIIYVSPQISTGTVQEWELNDRNSSGVAIGDQPSGPISTSTPHPQPFDPRAPIDNQQPSLSDLAAGLGFEGTMTMGELWAAGHNVDDILYELLRRDYEGEGGNSKGGMRGNQDMGRGSGSGSHGGG